MQTKEVLELPPRDSLRIIVSLLSRNGIKEFPASVSALITFPRVVKDKLIFLASSSVAPSAPVLEIRSLPAKSTRLRREVLVEPYRFLDSIMSIRIV